MINEKQWSVRLWKPVCSCARWATRLTPYTRSSDLCETCDRFAPTPENVQAWHAGPWPTVALWRPDKAAHVDQSRRWHGYPWGCCFGTVQECTYGGRADV